MASSYSMTKQTMKEKLGRGHATLDAQFSASWANCQQLEDIVDRIRAHMQEYMTAMKAMCQSGHAVADDFKTFYERQPERLTSISIKYEMIQNGFRTDKMALLTRLVNQNIFLRVEQLKVELAGLRSKVSDREVARKRYDHYHSKILELREQRSKQKAKGKELGASDLDKLTRNEKKFEDSRLEYVAINRVVARALWTTWTRRFQILDPIYAEVIKIKANFTQALSNQLQLILAPLKTQMQVPLREEPLPDVFAAGGAAGPPAAAGQVARAGASVAASNGYPDDGEHGVLSPGGTHEMDPRKLQAHMRVAAERMDIDAAVAQRKAAEQAARAAAKAGRPPIAMPTPSAHLEAGEEQSDEEEEEEEEEVAPPRKSRSKTAAAAATAGAPGGTRAPAARKPAVATPVDDDDDEDENIDDSDDDEEERARKARKLARKEKRREKERAAIRAAAAAPPAPKTKDLDSLDFLADMVGTPQMMQQQSPQQQQQPRKAKAKANAPVDLLAFASIGSAAPAPAAAPLLDFGMGAATASSAPQAQARKGNNSRLELDSFFGASSGALMPPPETSSHQSPDDPFGDLPTAEPAAPVDLLAIPPQQQQQQQPQQHYQQQQQAQHPYARAPSGMGGLGAHHTPPVSLGGTGSTLDDPFFSAPLPMPVSPLPQPTAAAAPAPAAAAPAPAAGVKSPGDFGRPKKKKAAPISSDSDSSDSSDSSDTSDSEQEEGRPPPKRKAAAAAAAAKPRAPAAASRAASASSATAAASSTAAHTADPFDFAANPTQSQLDASSAGAARSKLQSPSQPAAALLAKAAGKAPAKAAAAPPPHVAPAPSPHGPPVPSLPQGGLPDLYLRTASASPPAPGAASQPQAAAAPAAGAAVSPAAPGGPQSPEDYSPTRDDYNPFPDQAQPKPDDPFAGVSDW